MHFGDSIFIFLLALVLFGPKKLPEIGRTIGKLLAEFRRASNEFKFQIQEELRNMEEEERRKKLAEAQAQKPADTAAPPETSATTPTILPPSSGSPVSASLPYATPGPETTVTPSPAEFAVEPSHPTDIASPVIDSSFDPPAHLDLSSGGNGAHTSVTKTEPVESDVPSESLHHG